MLPPPPMPPSPQMFQDAEHLKLLAIFHYVMAGFSIIGGLGGAVYMAMGIFFVRVMPTLPATAGAHPPPPEMANFGWMFFVIGALVTLLCIAMAVCQILAGRWISARKNRTFCLVISGIECLSIPFGTVLGIFTIMVLGRPTVTALFEGESGLGSPNA